jgi:pectin methylesterase-like acyl-CoA thioesterase
MLDLKMRAEGPLSANASVAAEQLRSFVKLVKEVVDAAPRNGLELANTVTVQPGGKTFPTITAALNSITDASVKKQYLVQIGPGTYNEVVVCKEWVFIAGAGVAQTTITAPGSTSQANKGTVRAASHSAVQDVSIVSDAKAVDAWATAVDCSGAVDFDIENCDLQGNGVAMTNAVTLSVDFDQTGGGSQVNVAYSAIGAHGPTAFTSALMVYARGFVNVTDSKIVADTAETAWGASASHDSTIELYNTTVVGTMSLMLPDETGHITATSCKLIGPYSPGVVVNP